jgi:hypothetical protein
VINIIMGFRDIGCYRAILNRIEWLKDATIP